MSLKKIIALVLAFLLAINIYIPSSIVVADDVVEYLPIPVPNGGFESSATELVNWNPIITQPSVGETVYQEAYLSQKIVFSGTNSLRMVNNSTTNPFDLTSDKIPVTAGKTYRLTAKVYVESLSVSAYLRFKKADGVPGYTDDLAKSANVQNIRVLASNNGWQTFSIEAVAPEGAEFAELAFYMGKTTVAKGPIQGYIDEVKLEEKKVTQENPLELAFDNPVVIGDAVSIALSQSAAYGIGPDGKVEQYLTTTGNPAAFHAVDAVTGELLFTENLSSDTIWGMTTASDGNVYFGKTTNGELFRYVVKERRIESLGINPSNNHIWDLKASSDGKIYGATYSNAGRFDRVFEYDIATNQFKDLGVIKEGQQYARGLGVTDKYVYVGIGTTAYLMRYERTTGEVTELPIPDVSGKSGTISEIVIAGGKLLVNGGAKLHVLDEATGAYIRSFDFQSKVSSPSPYNPDLIYYKLKGELFTYNLKEDIIAKDEGVPELPDDTAIKAHAWITPTYGMFAGKTVLAGMAAYGESFLYDPVTNTYEEHQVDVPASPATPNALEANGDYLFIGGYQRGMSIYDTTKGEFIYNNKAFHQPEGIGFLDNIVYFGTYSGAKMYRLDMTKPLVYEELKWANPGLVADIGDEQDRPFTMTSGDGKLFIGTFPTYGTLGGALTILEEEKGQDQPNVEYETFRNIVPNQSLFGLAYKDGKVYGGTSRIGGLGIDPTESDAKMFVFDVASKQVTVVPFTPSFPGVNGHINLIGELSIGPDGLLWGIADNTVLKADNTVDYYNAILFAMNPETLEIVKSKVVTKSPANTSKYRPYYLRWGQDGLLYTTIGRQIFAVDPADLRAKQVVNGTVNLMTLGIDGSIYYLSGSKLYKIPVKIDHAATQLESNKLYVNDKTTASTSVQLVNGQNATMGGADIQYVSSNPSVATAIYGEITALSPGTTTIHASVTLDGRTVESSPVTLTVESKPTGGGIIIPTPTPEAEVYINGKAEKIGTISTENKDGRTVTTIAIDDKKLEDKLKNETDKAVVIISIEDDSDAAVGELSGQLVKNMEARQAILELKTETVTYTLPVQQIEIDKVLEQFGKDVALKDIKVQVEISKLTDEAAKIVENSSENGKFTVVAPPVEFTVRCINGNNVVEINSFNNYVERTITIPEIVDYSKITTGVTVDKDGLVRHVPTKLITIDGKYYAKINSLTNSINAVVSSPKEFIDMDNHWAKEYVNNLASRMIVKGIDNGNFKPDRDVTRAEFTTMVVKALGLKLDVNNNQFSDVKTTDWYYEFIETASEYGLISGYGNGKFGSMDTITREQAMTLVARAMDITGLNIELNDLEVNKLLEGFSDTKTSSDWAKANIAKCIKTGVVLGRGNNTIAPQDNITRGESATIIINLLSKSNLI